MVKKREQHKLEDLQAVLNEILGEPLVEMNVLKDIQVFHHSILQREAKRLKRKLGQDHPRVLRLEARANRNLNRLRDLEIELEVARIRVPEVEDDEALVHGRVVDENLHGVNDLKVSFEDEDGKFLRYLGKVETDDSGYYALCIDPESIEKASKVKGEGVYITFRTRDDKLVHREDAALRIAKGGREFLELKMEHRILRPVPEVKERAKEPSERKKEDTPKSDLWIVHGRVTDQAGEVLEGLIVRAYDKDRRIDDALGAALTDSAGHFRIAYPPQEFREGKEIGPDLYLTVMDAEGNMLYSSEDTILHDAGRDEVYDIIIGEKGKVDEGGVDEVPPVEH